MKNINFNRPILCSLLGVTLVGCLATGPVYRTSYHFTSPNTEAGKTCVNQCLVIKQRCNESCDRNNRLNSNEGNQKYLINIGTGNILRREQEKPKEEDFHKEFLRNSREREMEDFKRRKYAECKNSCDYDHRLCHQNCGGKVKSQTRCIRNCDQGKK